MVIEAVREKADEAFKAPNTNSTLRQHLESKEERNGGSRSKEGDQAMFICLMLENAGHLVSGLTTPAIPYTA